MQSRCEAQVINIQIPILLDSMLYIIAESLLTRKSGYLIAG